MEPTEPLFEEPELRECSNCGKLLEMSYFTSTKGRVFKVFKWCAPCREVGRLNSQKYVTPQKKKEISQKNRALRILKKYGLTLNEYNTMRLEQEFKCAICGDHEDDLPIQLVIDHDHNTGEIRALLCNPCNSGLGFFRDNPSRLALAIKYLEHFSQ